MDPANWTWGYNSEVVNDGDMLKCILTGEWGAMATGWNTTDLSGWDKIVIVVENLNGCDGEWFKLKAYLRDYVNKDSEQGQMEATLGLDAEDNVQNYLVIDLKEEGKNVNLTACGVLAIQCQPNGAEFKISRVYLEKEENVEREVAKLGINLPTENRPADNNIEMAGSFAEGTMVMEKIIETGWFVNYDFVNAAADDTFKFRAVDNNELVLCKFIPANGDKEEKWVQAIFKFGNYWQDDTWHGTPCKFIELDLSDGAQYAWMEGMPEPDPEEEGISNTAVGEKAQKVIMDGMIYIVRDGKLFNLQGMEIK